MTWKVAVPKPDPAVLAAAHQGLIEQAPIDLVLHRFVRARLGSGFGDWTEQPPEGLLVHARVALGGAGSTQVGDRLTGDQERDTQWLLLLPPDSGLHAGDGEDGQVRVEFLHPTHGRFRLRRLRPWDVGGQVVGVQGDLELIRGGSPPVASPAARGGRPRLEADPEHPWRQLVGQAELLRARNPSMTWEQVAARLGVSRERLDEYRRRARIG